LAIEASEQYADGIMEEEEWVIPAKAFDSTRRARFPKTLTPDDPAWTAVYCASHRRWQSYQDKAFAGDRWRLAAGVAHQAAESMGAEKSLTLAGFLRDVIGNPFRPVTVPAACLTPTVVSLAQAAYEHRVLPAGELEPARLAVLSDALEEAGGAPELLEHLRGPGPHVRGCHLLDLLRGKA
jgi:hypothetical protein